MSDTFEERLIQLAARLQYTELFQRVDDGQWQVRGLLYDADKRDGIDIADKHDTVGSRPSEAVAKALAEVARGVLGEDLRARETAVRDQGPLTEDDLIGGIRETLATLADWWPTLRLPAGGRAERAHHEQDQGHDSPGGPAVNQLNLPVGVTKISAEIYDLHTFLMWICFVIFRKNLVLQSF